jgi:methyl-accepting chemotaxis protein
MSIKVKLSFFMAVFLCLVLANTLTVQNWIAGTKGQAAQINIAGKQRMLSQKIVKEALLVASGSQKAIANIKQTISLFEAGLKNLEEGNQDLGLSSINDSNILDKLEIVHKTWTSFYLKVNNISLETPLSRLEQISTESVLLLSQSNDVVKLLEQDANDAVSYLSVMTLFFLFLALVIVGASYMYLHKFLISRIGKIQEISEFIVREKDITIRIGLEGTDELDKAAHAFDAMLDGFVSMYTNVKQVEKDLRVQVVNISEGAESNSQSMNQQTGEIIQVSTSINEMAATVQEIAQNTLNGSNAATECLRVANEGNNILDSNIALTNELAKEIGLASMNIEKLDEASHSIGGIANTISMIAEQTNLLALNAAIEAARAGEQGRGFAVVADEVRTLAQKTQEATNQIHNLISSFYEITNASVTTMENSRKRSEQSVVKSNTMKDAFENIISAVQSLSDISHQIAASTEEQSYVAEEMERNIIRIETQSKNTKEISNINAVSAQKLSGMSEQLSAQLGLYKI